MDSILTSVKKMLGIGEEYNHFDPDIIMHINSTFFTLFELGVGPSTPFRIEDDTAKWSDFIEDGFADAVKSYMALKVRLLFDPPQSSGVIELMKQQIAEYEWRLNVRVDPVTTF